MTQLEMVYYEGVNDGLQAKPHEPAKEPAQFPRWDPREGKEPSRSTDARRLAALIRQYA